MNSGKFGFFWNLWKNSRGNLQGKVFALLTLRADQLTNSKKIPFCSNALAEFEILVLRRTFQPINDRREFYLHHRD